MLLPSEHVASLGVDPVTQVEFRDVSGLAESSIGVLLAKWLLIDRMARMDGRRSAVLARTWNDHVAIT